MSDDDLIRARGANAESLDNSAKIGQDKDQLEILSACLEPLLKF